MGSWLRWCGRRGDMFGYEVSGRRCVRAVFSTLFHGSRSYSSGLP